MSPKRSLGNSELLDSLLNIMGLLFSGFVV